jgi:hypothetical protein
MLIGTTSPRRGAAVEVQPGRYTADIDGDFVVFLIGMRVNHPLRVRKWLPVVAAMPKMLKVLSQHPELGCLGFQQWFGRTSRTAACAGVARPVISAGLRFAGQAADLEQFESERLDPGQHAVQRGLVRNALQQCVLASCLGMHGGERAS